ncbi:hypothetical protein M378DRAFT_164452 [Amanita muscaria Koide BX008]|uniref:RapZ C-terminal domain-containing protein n=1 Tax=Amanita muscaria (strain Koide BX008) TaxID=946122 RepID=A0A0C2WPI7_AMAMK|nr:hypothetical protein M378DRAFT_164452 [Amanita muscaria Koide BX008]
MTVQDLQRPVLQITTFGHKNGLLTPPPDLLFDLRGVPNPPKELRTAARQTGHVGPMQEWLFSLGPVRQLFHDIRKQILQRLRDAELNGVKCVDMGLGCNLGRNRSVTIAEALASLDWNGWQVVVRHRDLGLQHAGKDLARPIIPSLRNDVTALLTNGTGNVAI